MLPPFIIEQIRKREERLSQEERPRLELPIERLPFDPTPSVSPQQDEPQRGVIVLDI